MVRICVLMKSGLGLYMGHLGLKTRSRGQIIEKPCVEDSAHNIHQIFLKFDQNVCLDKIWVGIVYGLSGVKN